MKFLILQKRIYHPTSGYLYGKALNTLEQLANDELDPLRKLHPYYPFVDKGEFELGKFLCDNLNQGQITQFLKLEWVADLSYYFKTREKPSFKNVGELLSWVEILPKGPRWHCTKIEMDNYVTVHPVYLLWRDGLDVAKQIFGNPIFSNHMSYDPHEITDQLPTGATIVPIILASDKTPVTRHAGNLEMHPLFLTIGNIQSDIRMKATTHAWSCIAYMPIAQFVAHSDYTSLLQARLWHRCMDIVCAELKIAATRGTYMVDPRSYLRYSFTPLISHVSDLPEQLMIACVSQNASPVTLATKDDFDDPRSFVPRTGMFTLSAIHTLSQSVNPWDVREYQTQSKAINLSGVHQPFWRDWRFADPAIFLTPELLHTCHKFFFDHVLNWCKEGLGKDELDSRYRSQHKRVGTRHFASGVSHVKQMSGREHRDVQRTIVATIAGPVEPEFVRTVRAMVDFIYKAQAPTFTDTSIADMAHSLEEFHTYKHSILAAEARRGSSGTIDHFKIPKLELLQSFVSSVHNVGNLIQYTADVSERLLITHCKNPFERTSRQRQDFTRQIVQLLDREETMRLFTLYALSRSRQFSLSNIIDDEYDEVVDVDPTLGWISRVSPEDLYQFSGKRPVRNYFLKGLLSSDAETAVNVTIAPTHKNKTIQWVNEIYRLPFFEDHLIAYVSTLTNLPMMQENLHFHVWNTFRLQLRSNFQQRKVMPSQLVQAHPPTQDYPFGNCDTLLLQSDYEFPFVVQVRCVFRFTHNSGLPDSLQAPLLYVELFDIIGLPDDNLKMYKVKRKYYPTALDARRERVAAVVSITDVTHAVELIPVYGRRMDRSVTAATSLHVYDEFYLNNYSDKEWYHTACAEYL
ncbi:hypothetical protein BJ138DRAFT_1220593 [Hygrophoropsis aurantiaca]|uniref:Uncharacterized protein n=1 Tax=Hygrophoropsis aurantiaca TaxID=72124 RepID=A0ACB8AKH7_9AGAM|nr:hypothetical protein BJ138DRAFT_1220593 [Hygrophoropsis aurantiaca]